MLDTGKFYFYNHRPVAITKLNLATNTALVRYIQRDMIPSEVEVDQSFLTPFSNKVANEEMRTIHKQIGDLNMRLHAINECLRYHTE